MALRHQFAVVDHDRSLRVHSRRRNGLPMRAVLRPSAWRRLGGAEKAMSSRHASAPSAAPERNHAARVVRPSRTGMADQAGRSGITGGPRTRISVRTTPSVICRNGRVEPISSDGRYGCLLRPRQPRCSPGGVGVLRGTRPCGRWVGLGWCGAIRAGRAGSGCPQRCVQPT